MARFRFSRRAEADLLSIGAYTLKTWGVEQTIRYVADLQTSCQTLADNPEAGRVCDDIRSGLRRMEHGRHVIFYRPDAEGILIARVLHQRMLPRRYTIEE
ncbi:MAG: type II toxin-antitoxin system RelE/ParE family toxin [Acidobacteriia bacterium]|nr:type II toxin-antitoxin system RelE/ParE family toxin [Terriglobia bacterium]